LRKLVTWIVALAVLAGGVYLGSPYYAVYRVVQAARANDAKTVNHFIDFPAVRASLRPQLQKQLEAQTERRRKQPQNLWDQLSLTIAPYLARPATELLITPQNVAAMIRTARAPQLSAPASAAEAKARLDDDTGPGDVRPLSFGYVGDDLDQFHVVIASRSQPGAKVRLGLLRRGFFTWKVVSLDLSGLDRSGR
jgi:hypothetical protein